MTNELLTPAKWLSGNIRVFVVGCGGTGSYLVSHLAQIDSILKVLSNNTRGLSVTCFDPDVVTEHNIGRQNFHYADIGFNKAERLVTRANTWMGTNWKHSSALYSGKQGFDVLFTCVDSAQSRYEIGKNISYLDDESIWIDGGNDADSGQVIAGHAGNPANIQKVPNLYDLYGDILLSVKEDRRDSCSVEESITRQEYGVNHQTALLMAQLFMRLVRHGKVGYQGNFFSQLDGDCQALVPTPDIWKSFGYSSTNP